MEEVDILHPQAEIQWKECCQLPEGIDDTRCVLLDDKLYIGGRVLSSGKYNKLYVSNLDLASWTTIPTPSYWFALTTFNSQLLLLGGIETTTEDFTNKVWSSNDGTKWELDVVPAMLTKRVSISATSIEDPKLIIVAGGEKEGFIPTGNVEVFIDNKWIAIQSLPKRCYDIKFNVYCGKIYILGGYGQDNTFVYWTDVKSILSVVKEARPKSPKSALWGKFELPLLCSNTISFGQQFITIGTEMGIDNTKIFARYPTKKTWVYAGSIPTDLRNVFSVLLSSKEMVVIGVDKESQIKKIRKVFKASLKLIPYNPNNHFTMETLSKLEAVCGISVVTSLGLVRTKLVSVAEITLDTKASQRLAFTENPRVYVEIIMGQWLAEKSDRSPTWYELHDLLKALGLHSTSQEIEDYMRGKLKFLEAYKQIVESRECIEMWFVKVILLGSSRQGKTTACRRLSGDIKDISSSNVGCQPSTGIVESGCNLILHYPTSTTATVLSTEWTTATDLDTEACMFLQYFYSRSRSQSSAGGKAKKKKGGGAFSEHSLENMLKVEDKQQEESGLKAISVVETLKSNESLKISVSSSDVGVTSEKPTPGKDSDGSENLVTSTVADQEEDNISAASEYVDSTSNLPNEDAASPKRSILDMQAKPLCPGDNEVTNMFRKAMDSKNWKGIRQYLQDITFLKMEDTGGQPEFMDMLPALTIGPGLYLLFCKLTEELGSHLNVTYVSPSGEASVPEESSYTVEDILLTSLASISCFHTNASTSDLGRNEVFNKSLAYIIGTHKDMVAEDDIEEFDNQLQQKVSNAEFYRDGLVQYSADNRMIFPIDNMHGGKSEVQKIRDFIVTGMKKHFKKLSIPAAWLVLSLCLRKREQRAASLESVQELANNLGMMKNETNLALWFLHHFAGVVMYYPEVPELKDLVICDSQIVYDSVTNLIVNAFKFGQLGRIASDKFRETGQFTLKDIERVTRKSTGDHVPLKKLIKLLEHLNIISCIPDRQQSQVATSTSDMTYFMPCVLPSLTRDEIDEWWDNIEDEQPSAAPLMIKYSCGYVPLGIFPALIANLARQKEFKLVVTGIKKNLVYFTFGSSKDTVIFVFQPKHFAIVYSQQSNTQQSDPNRPLFERCIALKQEIEKSLKSVVSRTNYRLCVEHQLGFECPSHRGRSHLCLVQKLVCPHSMICQQPDDSGKKKEMEDEHLVWFRNPEFHTEGCPNRAKKRYYRLILLIVGGILLVVCGLWLTAKL